jgi:hypothetical protein
MGAGGEGEGGLARRVTPRRQIITLLRRGAHSVLLTPESTADVGVPLD